MKCPKCGAEGCVKVYSIDEHRFYWECRASQCFYNWWVKPFTMNAGDQLGKNHYQFVSGNSTYATFMFENGQIFYIKLGADWAVDGGVFKVTKIYESTNHLADQAYIERLS